MYQLGKLYSLINEKSRDDEEKVELMVSICLIASCFAGFWELFWKFQRFQLLFSRIFPAFGLGWGAVLGISAVSATFLQNFSSFWAGLGSCFGNFSVFSYFFKDFSGCFAGVWGAVLGILAVSATFLQNFSSFWARLGSCFRSFMDYSYPRPSCYQPMAIVHYANLVWEILC